MFGYKVIGSDNDLPKLLRNYDNALITVGQIKSPTSRIRLFKHLQELDYQLPIIVSPRAYVSKHAQIGEGTIVLHDAMVNANAKIGNNCVIGAKSLITENKEIPDNSLVVGSPGKVIRKVTDEEVKAIKENAIRYQENWKKYSKSSI